MGRPDQWRALGGLIPAMALIVLCVVRRVDWVDTLFVLGGGMALGLAHGLFVRRWPSAPTAVVLLAMPMTLLLALYVLLMFTAGDGTRWDPAVLAFPVVVTRDVPLEDSWPYFGGGLLLIGWDFYWHRQIIQSLAPAIKEHARRWQWRSAGLAVFYLAGASALAPAPQARDCCGGPSVKANAHTVQTMLENYAVDWAGRYPTRLPALLQEAQEHDYAHALKNPFSPPDKPSLLQYRGPALTQQSDGLVPGAVYLELVSPARYHIYAIDSTGKALRDNEHLFVLTND